MDRLIKITPDMEKASSILKMADTTIEMIKIIDVNRFGSNLIKEYYDIIRELVSVVLLLDGYKTYGEGAHKKLVEYLENNYKEFTAYEISLIDDLRIIRNKIAYDGFFVDSSYLERKLPDIIPIITKLKSLSVKKLQATTS